MYWIEYGSKRNETKCMRAAAETVCHMSVVFVYMCKYMPWHLSLMNFTYQDCCSLENGDDVDIVLFNGI